MMTLAISFFMLVIAMCKEWQYETFVDIHCEKSGLLVSSSVELGNDYVR
jgi:hypothetical protein